MWPASSVLDHENWEDEPRLSGRSLPVCARANPVFSPHMRTVKRRLLRAGIPPVFSNHSFRATGITEFLANGGSLEIAQQLANHAESRTTRLNDRRATRLELEEIVRIGY